MATPPAITAFKHHNLLAVPLLFWVQVHAVLGCYTSIFSFGDSLADTGNFKYSESHEHPYDFFPYGETFFGHPTGRCADGRLVIDFIAQDLGLRLIKPYLGLLQNDQDFSEGVNFAVAGATALDVSFFEERGIYNSLTNLSLAVQLGWFKQFLPSLCNSSSSCRDTFTNSLFLVGEIGGNDYNYPFFLKGNLHEVHSFVPEVINAISSTITALIDEGAVTFLVPGNLPIGCSASYLTIYQSQNTDEYDSATGCLNWLNDFSQYHNQLLQNELDRLRKLHPQATIIYADYYNVAMELYRFPKRLGFSNTLTACCGGGGPYNYNLSSTCGEGSSLCDDVSLYVSWDGVHLTEAAYKFIATGIMNGPYTTPRINVSCTSDS